MKRNNSWTYRGGCLVWVDHFHVGRIGTVAGSKRPNGYWYLKNALVHRLVWEWHYGEVPAGYFVDHIDGDLDNNCVNNLRLVSPAQSSANRGPMKIRPYPKGVRPYAGKWRAYIDGKHLGTFNTLDEAFTARLQAETPYHRKSYYKVG